MVTSFSRTYSTLALVAAMAAAPMVATAASDGGYDNGSDGGSWHHQKMHRGHDMHRGWSGPMLRKLDLTQAQKDQIFKIRHDQAQAFYDEHKALRAAAKQMRDVTTADTFDQDKAQQAAAALGKAESQMALLRAQTQAQIRAVLTPEQRQKLANWRTHRHASKKSDKS